MLERAGTLPVGKVSAPFRHYKLNTSIFVIKITIPFHTRFDRSIILLHRYGQNTRQRMIIPVFYHKQFS